MNTKDVLLERLSTNTNKSLLFDNEKYRYVVNNLFSSKQSYVVSADKNNIPTYLPDENKVTSTIKRKSFSKTDYLSTEAYQQKGGEKFIILFAVESAFDDRFYEPAVVLANIFDQGGWISENFAAIDFKARTEVLSAGYERYDKVEKKLYYLENKFYYLVMINFSKKYQSLKDHMSVRDIFYQRLKELKNANRSLNEIARNSRNAVSDFMLEYDSMPILHYAIKHDYDISIVYENIKLLEGMYLGKFLQIASLFFTDGQFSIISDKELTLPPEEFDIRMGY